MRIQTSSWATAGTIIPTTSTPATAHLRIRFSRPTLSSRRARVSIFGPFITFSLPSVSSTFITRRRRLVHHGQMYP